MKLKMRFSYIVIGASILLAILSISVIAGWYTKNQALVQVHPSFAPMQFNTALGFLLCGVSLMFMGARQIWLGKFAGGLVFLLGAVTFAQYTMGIDLGIDNFFVEPEFITKTSHPGRMSPITALCFSIVGLSLLFMRLMHSLAISLGLCALVLASLVLAVYFLGGGDSIYGWGTLSRMAIHTALGFMTAGVGVLFCWALYRHHDRRRFEVWQVLPFSIAIIVLNLTFFFWYSYEESVQVNSKVYFNNLISETQTLLLDRYEKYEEALRGGVGLYYASENVSRDEWKRYVSALNVDDTLPGINGMGYIDYVLSKNMDEYLKAARADEAPSFTNHPDTFYPDKFIIKFIEPVDRNIEAVGLDIGFEANRRAAAERARDLGVPALTKKILLVQDHQKTPGFLLLIPTYTTYDIPSSIEDRRENFMGWVYAPFIGSNFLEGINDINKNQLDFQVYDGNRVNEDALIHATSVDDVSDGLKQQTQIKIAGRVWTILWRSNDRFTLPQGQGFGRAILILGLGFAFLIYFLLERLLHNRELIQRRVDERTKELTRSNKELERFAYIASHDLQEPLRKIGGFVDRLKTHLGDDLDKKSKQYMDFVTGGVDRMGELIQGLLSYSLVTTTKVEVTELDTNDVVAVAVDNLSETIAETGAKINYKNLPVVFYDKVMLTQVFQNLIGNAIKYKGDVAPKIDISAKKASGYWEFSVKDNGMGMERKHLEHIFEMFQRLHRKEDISGTGIGLSLCQKIVERYGGRIWVESSPGKGSTFFFTVPDIS